MVHLCGEAHRPSVSSESDLGSGESTPSSATLSPGLTESSTRRRQRRSAVTVVGMAAILAGLAVVSIFVLMAAAKTLPGLHMALVAVAVTGLGTALVHDRGSANGGSEEKHMAIKIASLAPYTMPDLESCDESALPPSCVY
eukprot:CAMPEP_0197895094 /NCGR_PEP_ID=MMETSP1439-20131203/36483_1 /TAXON_ID=66791 /ORGANISM="Gonyaulax spinifera, Strain CCMP409" /LENGTH=140 /DNA_ID=CAMNT_0043515503 /DNA_START=71 /DNA_END=493 /DNA_ORIENTATION=-